MEIRRKRNEMAQGYIPIGKSSKNIEFSIFPLNMGNTGIVRIYIYIYIYIYILTMVPLLWPIFHGKPC